ncbi:hypothetical protein DFH06DRAFT_1473255 [Mycena polygramma]|nr:hypothetical protein DFH06DRAFT_1473255 [Mycena polygramma]
MQPHTLAARLSIVTVTPLVYAWKRRGAFIPVKTHVASPPLARYPPSRHRPGASRISTTTSPPQRARSAIHRTPDLARALLVLPSHRGLAGDMGTRITASPCTHIRSRTPEHHARKKRAPVTAVPDTPVDPVLYGRRFSTTSKAGLAGTESPGDLPPPATSPLATSPQSPTGHNEASRRHPLPPHIAPPRQAWPHAPARTRSHPHCVARPDIALAPSRTDIARRRNKRSALLARSPRTTHVSPRPVRPHYASPSASPLAPPHAGGARHTHPALRLSPSAHVSPAAPRRHTVPTRTHTPGARIPGAHIAVRTRTPWPTRIPGRIQPRHGYRDPSAGTASDSGERTLLRTDGMTTGERATFPPAADDGQWWKVGERAWLTGGGGGARRVSSGAEIESA